MEYYISGINFEQNVGIVKLLDEINQNSIFKLCIEIEISLDYYKYDKIEIRIDSTNDRNVVDIITINCANRFFFRSQDHTLKNLIKSLIPEKPDYNRVIDVRPLASLEAGQCYYTLANGKCGIKE